MRPGLAGRQCRSSPLLLSTTWQTGCQLISLLNKRWTNYTLSQEEQRSETGRRFDRTIERITFLEDSLQEMQDLLHQATELTARRLQSLMSVVHEWVSDNERVQGVR